MLWAFSRDGAMPFSNVWHTVNKRTKVPFNAVWGMVLFAILLGCAITLSPLLRLDRSAMQIEHVDGRPLRFATVSFATMLTNGATWPTGCRLFTARWHLQP